MPISLFDLSQCMIILQEGDVKKVKELFPFNEFFENAPQPVFKGRNFDEDMDIAEGCFRHIRKIFQQLEVNTLHIKSFTT